MAGTRYGTRLYGTVYYGGDVLDEFIASSFSATANGYGRALVSWSRPGGAWNRQRLVRSLAGVPVYESDGDVLLDEPNAGASRQWQDTELAPGRFYYYGLFVRDQADNQWRRAGTAQLLATQEHGYSRRLFDRLPEVYKVSDYTSLAQRDDLEEDSFLYRWLSTFGLQLDHVRSELEGLRDVNDPRLVSSSLLPSLARMVGIEYEPELGDRAVRRLTANAVRLSTIKGTLAGIREYSTVFTGWDSSVRIGHNIALDRLDAGPDGGVGRWTGKTNATTSYQAHVEETRGPAGDGAILLRAIADGPSMEAGTNPAGSSNPLERLQYAVPVIPGMRYVVSQYARTTRAGLTARMGMTWLDAAGEQVIGTGYGPTEALEDDWASRPSSTELAPPGARYLETTVRVDGSMFANDVVQVCGLQVQEGGTVLPWAPARELLVYLRGDLRNFVGNTSGYGLTAEGWTYAVAFEDQYAPGSYYLAFSATLATADQAVEVIDAVPVEYEGDIEPTRYATYDETAANTIPNTYQQRLRVYPTYSSASLSVEGEDDEADDGFISVYTSGIREVSAHETWSVLVDAVGPYGEYDREVQVGFACYDGDSFVGYEWGELTMVGLTTSLLTHELTVPDNAPYDRVAFAIRSLDVVLTWKNAALENARLADAKQFDGSTPSRTGDYLWEGVPYRSTSHYYSRRVVRATRLRALLVDYVPHPASFKLVFATNTIPDSPRSASGSDLDPDDSPATFVGVRARARWANLVVAGNEAPSAWAVISRQVGVELESTWNLEHIHRLMQDGWHLSENVGIELLARWHSGTTPLPVDFSFAWSTHEDTHLSETIVVSNILSYDQAAAQTDPDTYTGRQATFPAYEDTDPDA